MTNDLPTVASDSASTRLHRAHQGRWREGIGWPPGPPSDARAQTRYDRLTNYLAPEHDGQTPEAAGINLMSTEAVEYTRERLGVLQRIDGVAETDRLWRNLLSSQPLAFSLAGHLRAHPDAAASLFAELTGRDVAGLASLRAPRHVDHELHGIEAEWFPPRELHTGDRSGFDIAALLALRDGRHLLLTIEVKYVDSFSPAKLDLNRYAGVLDAPGVDRGTAAALVAAGGS